MTYLDRPARLRRPAARPPLMLALEPRFMFDGAAVADAAQAAADSDAVDVHALLAAVPAAVSVREADPALNGGRKEVVFVDTAVADYKVLEAGIRQGVEIVEIGGGADGLAQMAAWAETHSGYDAIHVLGHGDDGTIILGAGRITTASLADAAIKAELAILGQALTADGDLLVYGCSVAGGDNGASFLAKLAAVTGADVAASDDPTGAVGKGGDWDLESRSGAVEADDVVDRVAVADYDHVLAALGSQVTVDFTAAGFGTTTAAGGTSVGGQSYTNSGFSFTWGTTSADPINGASDKGQSNGASLFMNGASNGAETLTIVSTTSGETFKFTSFYLDLTFVEGDCGTWTVEGFLNNVSTGTQTFSATQVGATRTLNTNTNLQNVDKIVITSDAGSATNSGFAGNFDTFVFDVPVVADSTAPTFDVAPAASSVTGTTLTFSGSIDEAGTVYYVAVANNAAAPSVAQVMAGQDSSGAAALKSGNSVVGSTPFTASFSVTGLTAGTDYDFYMVAKDSANNQMAAVTKVDVTTGPDAANDTAAATEAGGNANGTAGTDPTGNVLTNDTGSSLSVTSFRTGNSEGAGTAGTLGQARTGSYGSLTLAADGSYTYVVDNTNATVQALAAGATLTDSFNYTIQNGSGGTDIAVLTVTITGVNDLPSLGGSFTTNGTVNDDSTATPFANVTFTDVDSNGTVTITFTGANGTLSSASGGLTENSSGNYTLTSDTAGNIQTKLRALVFTPTANQAAPGSTVVTTFTVTPADAVGSGTADATTQVTATSVNNAPTVSAGGTMAYTEKTPAVIAPAITISDSDVDSDWVGGNAKLTVQITANADANDSLSLPTTNPGAGGVWVDTSAGNALKIDTTTIGTASAASVTAGALLTLTFTGATDAQVQAVARALTFDSDTFSPSTSTRTVTFTAYDKTVGSSSATRDISVTNVNGNPVFLSGTTATVSEAATNGTAVINDGDGGATDTGLTYTIQSGNTGSVFAIGAGTGAITVANALDRETTGSYTLVVRATDGGGATTDQTITVTLGDVNDSNPVISSNGGGATAAISIAENVTAVTTLTATDADSAPTQTYSIIGGADSALFAINASTGVLTFATARDFETPADQGDTAGNNTYVLQVQVSDGTNTDTQTITVTVTNVNENPIFSSGTTATVSEAATNGTAVIDE
ncbi:MAG: autotransporter adhesin [Stygiobacter sp.]|nr:MAG: autotransporter adhesin [Stygiobacter sp.]